MKTKWDKSGRFLTLSLKILISWFLKPLRHLLMKDIYKKRFNNVRFFGKNKPCTNCGGWNGTTTEYGHKERAFFSKTSNFWAWADKLGGKFWGHLGYFRPIYQRLPLGRWTCEMPGSLRRCQKGRLCGPGEVGVPDRGPSSWVLENIAPPILSLWHNSVPSPAIQPKIIHKNL